MTNKRPIADIIVGNRHRKELGDIGELAASIKAQGLLQPIGILPDNQLVFGHRRLLACRDLGWTEIDVRLVPNVTSIVVGEMHENEMRKQFTLSERAAIYRSIATIRAGTIGRGRKLDRRHRDDLTRPTADQAAKMAGFAGRGVAYRAVKVVDCGIPQLVEAMDNAEIPLAVAAEIATEAADQQAAQLSLAKAQRVPVKREKKKAPAPKAKPLAQIFAERDARLNAPTNGAPFTTLQERGYPPPELAQQQHPDYPPGVTYANAHRMEHGRIQLWPIAEKKQMDLVQRFNTAFGACTQLDPADLAKLNDKRRASALFTIRKVLKKFMHLLPESAA